MHTCYIVWCNPDMCNQRAAVQPAALFGVARLVLFMILKWYFTNLYKFFFVIHIRGFAV